jgi:endonuclease-3
MVKKLRKSGGRLKPAEIAEVFDRFAAADPDPRGELAFINPYTLLVAVVLSAQATDASVNKATEPLFKLVDNPAAMVKLGEAKLGIHPDHRPLQHQGQERHPPQPDADRAAGGGAGGPRHPETCRGRAQDRQCGAERRLRSSDPAVDTHIFRVCNRTGLAPERRRARSRTGSRRSSPRNESSTPITG